MIWYDCYEIEIKNFWDGWDEIFFLYSDFCPENFVILSNDKSDFIKQYLAYNAYALDPPFFYNIPYYTVSPVDYTVNTVDYTVLIDKWVIYQKMSEFRYYQKSAFLLKIDYGFANYLIST